MEGHLREVMKQRERIAKNQWVRIGEEFSSVGRNLGGSGNTWEGLEGH
jgi:hypothetical protein